GNRDFVGLDFRWVQGPDMGELKTPEELMVVERREWGNFYGYLQGLRVEGKDLEVDGDPWQVFQEKIDESTRIFEEIRHIEKDLIGSVNYQMERIRLKERGYELEGELTTAVREQLDAERKTLQAEYESYTEKLSELYSRLNRVSFVAVLNTGKQVEIPMSRVVRAFRPNAMNPLQKVGFYFTKLWEFVSDDPREANTEGGIFPAIFGTVMMVMVMAVMVTPFGVVAAVYLREYAKQGFVTRLIRIAVNNLAGVPSVVYGVFGLGFFVYFLGGSIDKLFFPEALPAPTFGTPGLLWASLTLAILTVPVVIVATEEGLSRVPRAIREGSLALGATKAETLWRTVLPMTASAMMTGLILAVARAAGEVAPLMLVGVVKLAPSLPLDGNFPYLHMDRKFMHLGFHIYDVGFQSPNVEAARPLVYATALLLVLIIIILNLTAIRIRNRLREKYRAAEQH
ncbi:MAG: phosphate ABC transporter permease PstA, partial [Gammaproteobacteria bacterium]|nr:phosphate ABC transporter permease PstA [Gammaproteobacteria bacterium]